MTSLGVACLLLTPHLSSWCCLVSHALMSFLWVVNCWSPCLSGMQDWCSWCLRTLLLIIYFCSYLAVHSAIAVNLERSFFTACMSGVPQGSVLGGSMLSWCMCHPLHGHSVQYHQYTDNLLHLSLVPDSYDLSSVCNCTSDMSDGWFLKNAVLLNPTRTESAIFRTRQWLWTESLKQNLLGHFEQVSQAGCPSRHSVNSWNNYSRVVLWLHFHSTVLPVLTWLELTSCWFS